MPGQGVADYQAQIRLGVQGLNQLGQLERRLENAVNLLGRLERAQANVGQAAQSAERNLERARQRMSRAGFERTRANRTVENVSLRRDIETGRFAPGGGTLAARRMANAGLRLAERETREAARNLREQERNRRLVAAAEQRYARALDRAGNALGGIQGGVLEQQARVDQAMRGIGQGSRGNYLTNLFQGRQQEFARGGAGRGLPAQLQQQARNVREAWDLATAGGKENLQLMQRLSTEMAGLVRQQNELNRSGAGRSIAFEAGRRGQERITALSRMAGADPGRIRGLRSAATNVIATGNAGDIASAREAQRRMNVAITRYERELNAAAKELRIAQRRGGPSSPIRGSATIEGSPAYIDRLARMGGPRQSVKGRKDLPGSPAYIEEQQKQQARQLARAVRMGGPREGIKGRKDLVGSPAYYEEQRRQLDKAIRAGGPRENIKGRKDLPGSPAYIEAEQKRAEQAARLQQRDQERRARADQRERNRIARLRQRASPIRGTATMVGSPAYIEAQQRAQMAQQRARRLGPASPVRGTATMVGSPAYLAAQQRQRPTGLFRGSLRQGIGEGLIGGAFPLLFGQGLGASAGGLAGGFGGGLMGGSFGFGLSLIGTAVGGALDTTANNLKELAGALKSPNDAMTALEKSGFNVSDSLKFQVEQLQSVGRAYDAQTLVLREVEKRLGGGAVKELNALNGEQKKLQESWAILAGDIQRAVIPAVIGFTVVLNDLVNFINGIRSRKDAAGKDVDMSRRNYRLNPFTGRLEDAGARQRSQGRVEKAISAATPRVALNASEAYEAESKRIDESRQLADKIQSAYREAFSLQRRAHDLQRDGADINRETADYSYRKQREIFELRQQVADKEIENTRAAAQNRIERGDLSARQTFAAAVGFEQQLLSNVRETMRTRMEGEADIEQSRRRLELAMARLNRDAEDYKRTNAREIEDIERRKLAYIRSVEDYKMQVADHVRDRSIEAAEAWRKAMALAGTPTGASGAPAPGVAAPATGPAVSGRYIQGGWGPRGPNQYGAHFDIARQDASYFDRAALDRYVLVNGAPLSRGLTVSGGRFGASRDGGRREHRAWDYAFGQNAALTLTGGARWTGSSRGSYGDNTAFMTPDGKVYRIIHGRFEGTIGAASSPQAQASTQISNIPAPTFKPTPIGPTPSAAPASTANAAAYAALGLSTKDAQRISEEQIKLRQKGIELGQIEQILQNNQLPQLQQQYDTLRLQMEARRQNLSLSDQAATIADAEAEATTRIAQIEKDRKNALAGVQKQYGNNLEAIGQVNRQADAALNIAKGEEELRRKIVELNTKAQGQERARAEILQMQEALSIAKVEAAALENGQLQASSVELMKASTLYQQAEEAQQRKLVGLATETEELRKQNEFRRQMVEMQRDTGLVGAGLRAGFIGAGARAFEQGLRDFNGDTTKATDLAKQSQLLESQRLVWDNLERSIVGVSDAISGALTNGLVDIASGSKKIEDVGRDMLNNMARSFADAAQQQLTALMQRQLAGVMGGLLGGGAPAAGGGILGSFLNAPSLIPGFAPSFSFGGFLANGGDAKAGEAYVVGEKEPEFFFPGVNGRVVPKSEMEKVAGLRRASASDDPIDINYTVTEQAGQRYVTEEQFRKSNAAVVLRARAATYAGMRNSRDVREYAGLD